VNIEIKDKEKFRFRLGVILIVINYILWGSSLIFAAMALQGFGYVWWQFTGAAVILSWITFIAGILFAGRRAIRYIHSFLNRIIKRILGKNVDE
jgi:hypothetical protein